jgi:hypothetical protein
LRTPVAGRDGSEKLRQRPRNLRISISPRKAAPYGDFLALEPASQRQLDVFAATRR